jgi:predicted CXXCH cytochrome family protein
MTRFPFVLSIASALMAALLAPGAGRGQTDEALDGTPHDFSEVAVSREEGCDICHLPFAAAGNKGGADQPEVYAPVLSVEGVDGMGARTALCLSCHDGVTAQAVGSHQLGTSHPASAAYEEGTPGLRSPEEVEQRGLTLDRVDGGFRVECTSCHTGHDNSQGSFLRISNQGSAVCLACHIK